jgi:hypothetical protein
VDYSNVINQKKDLAVFSDGNRILGLVTSFLGRRLWRENYIWSLLPVHPAVKITGAVKDAV